MERYSRPVFAATNVPGREIILITTIARIAKLSSFVTAAISAKCSSCLCCLAAPQDGRPRYSQEVLITIIDTHNFELALSDLLITSYFEK